MPSTNRMNGEGGRITVQLHDVRGSAASVQPSEQRGRAVGVVWRASDACSAGLLEMTARRTERSLGCREDDARKSAARFFWHFTVAFSPFTQNLHSQNHLSFHCINMPPLFNLIAIQFEIQELNRLMSVLPYSRTHHQFITSVSSSSIRLPFHPHLIRSHFSHCAVASQGPAQPWPRHCDEHKHEHELERELEQDRGLDFDYNERDGLDLEHSMAVLLEGERAVAPAAGSEACATTARLERRDHEREHARAPRARARAAVACTRP